MSNMYILRGPAGEDGNPIPAKLMEWATYFETARERRVVRATLIKPDGQDTFEASMSGPDGIWVSTVFTGLDSNVSDIFGPLPILWESMAFQDHDGLAYSMRRYDSLDFAKKGHQQMVDDLCNLLRDGKPIADYGRYEDEKEAQ